MMTLLRASTVVKSLFSLSFQFHFNSTCGYSQILIVSVYMVASMIIDCAIIFISLVVEYNLLKISLKIYK